MLKEYVSVEQTVIVLGTAETMEYIGELITVKGTAQRAAVCWAIILESVGQDRRSWVLSDGCRGDKGGLHVVKPSAHVDGWYALLVVLASVGENWLAFPLSRLVWWTLTYLDSLLKGTYPTFEMIIGMLQLAFKMVTGKEIVGAWKNHGWVTWKVIIEYRMWRLAGINLVG